MTSETSFPSTAGALQCGLDGDLAELVRRQVRESPVKGADRRARGADNDDVVLHDVLLVSLWIAIAWRGRAGKTAGHAIRPDATRIKRWLGGLKPPIFDALDPIPDVSGRPTSEIMAKSDDPITIKKYANRRLYNTGTSTYVTLEDLATMVKAGENFVVYDAKSSEDITRSVLAQIIFEQENKEGQNLLPINFLRQLIRFYGNSMQMMVPRYLEVSLESFTQGTGKDAPADGAGFRRRCRCQPVRSDGGSGPPQHGDVREGVLDVHAVRAARGRCRCRRSGAGRIREGRELSEDIDALKRQIEEMQRRIDKISDKD